MHIRPPALGLLVCLIAFPALPAQAQSGEPLHDLRLAIEPNRPLLLSLRTEHNGRLKIGKTIDLPLKATRRVEVVDVYEKVDVPNYVSRRRYVRAEENVGKSKVDPPLVGVSVRVTEDQDNVGVKVLDDRRLPESKLDSLLVQSTSIGAWVRLPKEVPIGGKFDLGFHSLAAFMLDLQERPDEAKAELELERVDPQKNLAILRGPASISGAIEMMDEKVAVSFEGELVLRVDLEARLVESLELTGATSAKETTAGGPLTLASKDRYRLTVTTGKKASSNLKKRVSHRKVTRFASTAGVSIVLPAFWWAEGLKDGADLLVAFEHGDYVELQIERFESPDPKLSMQVAIKSIREDHPKAKVSSGRSPLGRFQSLSIQGQGGPIHIDLVAGKDALYRVMWLSSDGKVDKALLKDRKAALKTLRPASDSL